MDYISKVEGERWKVGKEYTEQMYQALAVLDEKLPGDPQQIIDSPKLHVYGDSTDRKSSLHTFCHLRCRVQI